MGDWCIKLYVSSNEVFVIGVCYIYRLFIWRFFCALLSARTRDSAQSGSIVQTILQIKPCDAI